MAILRLLWYFGEINHFLIMFYLLGVCFPRWFSNDFVWHPPLYSYDFLRFFFFTFNRNINIFNIKNIPINNKHVRYHKCLKPNHRKCVPIAPIDNINLGGHLHDRWQRTCLDKIHHSSRNVRKSRWISRFHNNIPISVSVTLKLK